MNVHVTQDTSDCTVCMTTISCIHVFELQIFTSWLVEHKLSANDRRLVSDAACVGRQQAASCVPNRQLHEGSIVCAIVLTV